MKGLWVKIATLVVVAGLFTFLLRRIPLLNVVGYEFSLAEGALLYLISAWIGFFILREYTQKGCIATSSDTSEPAGLPPAQPIRDRGEGEDIFEAALTLALWLLLILNGWVLGLGLLNGLWVKNCDIPGGVRMFGFITLPASFLGLSVGFLSATLTRSFWKATGWVVGFAFLSIFWSFLEHYAGPRVSLHNLILGQVSFYFYSSSTRIFPSFLYHRYFAIGLALIFLTLSYIRMAGKSHHLLKRRIGFSFLGLLLILTIIPAFFFSDEMGLTSGRKVLDRRLGTALISSHIRLHFSSEEFSHTTARRILGELEWAYEQNASALQLTEPWKVEAFLYQWGTKEALTGGRDVLFAKPWRHEIHITSPVDEIVLRHELVHTMAADFGRFPYGVPYNFPLTEGLAEAISRDMGKDMEAHSKVAAALQAGNLPDPVKFMSNRGFLSYTPYQVYNSAGSFVGFLIQRYGTGPVKRLYRGIPYRKAFSKSLPELGKEWRDFLSTLPVRKEERKQAEVAFSPTYAPVFYAQICPREREYLKQKGDSLRNLGNYAEAMDIFQSFHRLELKNPEWLLELADTEFQEGSPDEAKAHLKEIFEKNYPADFQLRAYQLLESESVRKKDIPGLLNTLAQQEELTSSPWQLFLIQQKKQALEDGEGLELYSALLSPCIPSSYTTLLTLSQSPKWKGLLLLLLPCEYSLKTLDRVEKLQSWISQQRDDLKEIFGDRLITLGNVLYQMNELNGAERAFSVAKPFLSPATRKKVERLLQKVAYVKNFLSTTGDEGKG